MAFPTHHLRARRTESKARSDNALLLLLLLVAPAIAQFNITSPNNTTNTNSTTVINLGNDRTFTIIGSLSGDPIINGFDGRAFDFMGRAGTSFNVISTPDTAVNVMMVEANLANHTEGGTFMGALHFAYRSHSVQASITPDGVMAVDVDGQTLDGGRFYQEWDEGQATVEVEPHFPNLGHVLVLSTPWMVLRIQAVQPLVDPVTGFNRGHLDFVTTLLALPPSIHGVLGQTVASIGGERYPLDDMAFHGEGEPMDYATSSLTATDDMYSLFTGGAAEGHTAMSRRLAAVTPLEAPLYAGRAANVHLVVG